MTLDKIRHYIGDDLYNFWAGVKDPKIIKKAADLLSAEIAGGLRWTASDHAELKYLRHLINE